MSLNQSPFRVKQTPTYHLKETYTQTKRVSQLIAKPFLFSLMRITNKISLCDLRYQLFLLMPQIPLFAPH
jgi:hypothetical protein